MDAHAVWQAALARMQSGVSAASYTTWLRGTVGLELTDRRLVVGVSTTFAADHLRARFREMARLAVTEAAGEPLDVEFCVRAQRADQPRAKRVHRPLMAAQAAPAYAPYVAPAAPLQGSAHAIAQSALVQAPLLRLGAPLASPPRQVVARPSVAEGAWTFANFAPGASNELAVAAAQDVVAAPGRLYNPLFICGAPGQGKTHLLHAVATALRADGKQVVCVSAEQFMRDFVESVYQQRAEAFRRRYREVDALLLDDISLLAGKEATEEELFHTFNALHGADRQIVLTSSVAPGDLRTLHERLRSRFGWGLTVELAPPDLAHRLALLRAWTTARGVTIGEDVLQALASGVCVSVAALQARLAHALTLGAMERGGLTMERARLALGADATQPILSAIQVTHIMHVVATHFEVGAEALCGRSRARQVAWARQVAMYLLRERTICSLSEIGRALGGRDHSTILHGCAQVSQRLNADPTFRTELAVLQATLL